MPPPTHQFYDFLASTGQANSVGDLQLHLRGAFKTNFIKGEDCELLSDSVYNIHRERLLNHCLNGDDCFPF